MLIKMNPLILINTKLSVLSNDRIVYLNLFDHVLFLREYMRMRNNSLGFSCDSSEYTSKTFIMNIFFYIYKQQTYNV